MSLINLSHPDLYFLKRITLNASFLSCRVEENVYSSLMFDLLRLVCSSTNFFSCSSLQRSKYTQIRNVEYSAIQSKQIFPRTKKQYSHLPQSKSKSEVHQIEIWDQFSRNWINLVNCINLRDCARGKIILNSIRIILRHNT